MSPATRKHGLEDTSSDGGGKRFHSSAYHGNPNQIRMLHPFFSLHFAYQRFLAKSPSPLFEQQTRKADLVVEGWLAEFHRYLWNQPQREREIFLTAHLTPDHYIKLQNELDAQFPNRHTDSYEARSDVTTTKLGILRSAISPDAPPTDLRATTNATTVSTADIESQEDETGEDDEIGDDLNPEFTDISRFLPTRMRYLDLSMIPFSSLPLRCPLPLRIREEYDIMANILDNGLLGETGSVVLTGPPGTGMRVYFLMHFF
jgi:hypothetical protein